MNLVPALNCCSHSTVDLGGRQAVPEGHGGVRCVRIGIKGVTSLPSLVGSFISTWMIKK